MMRPFAGVLLMLTTACAAGGGSGSAPAPRRLSPDSMALLEQAVRQARPAFTTQQEALLSGIYGQGPPAVAARVESESGPAATSRASSPIVIQIAAYRDPATARAAAVAAGRRFPDLEIVIEAAGDLHRVAFGGPTVAESAESVLHAVRRYYPDAWLRGRALP